MAITNEEKIKLDFGKCEGLKSKLFTLCEEYRERGLSGKQILECIEFVQIQEEKMGDN